MALRGFINLLTLLEMIGLCIEALNQKVQEPLESNTRAANAPQGAPLEPQALD
jgi:hypothetical protein